jgi:hypothetical protein
MPGFYILRIGDLDFLAGLGDSPGFLYSANRRLDSNPMFFSMSEPAARFKHHRALAIT